jgi:hypothetical protein
MDHIEKIRKLLSLGQSASDNEASLALEMAAKLMAKWGIDELDLLIKEDSLDGLGDLQREILYQSKRIPYWRTCLSHALAISNHCKALIVPGFGLMVYGHSENINKVKTLWDLICPQVDSWTKTRCAGKGRTYASSYRLGMVFTLQKRLSRHLNALISERDAPSQTALAVVTTQVVEDVDAFVEKHVGKANTYQNSVRSWSDDAYGHGKSDGERLDTVDSGSKQLT